MMSLTKRIHDEQLLYYARSPEGFSIFENTHYRWMCISGVIQSIMHLKHPQRLTLPHHIALSLPLLYIQPASVLEFGLGGGNMARFILSLAPHITYTSIESEQKVIDCFYEYFNPSNVQLSVHQNNANTAQALKNSAAQWIIYDIYPTNRSNSLTSIKHACAVIEKNPQALCLSINMPQGIKNDDMNLYAYLQRYTKTHNIYCFNVPNYKNVIIHFISKKIEINPHNSNSTKCLLPQSYSHYWSGYWKCSHQIVTGNQANYAG